MRADLIVCLHLGVLFACVKTGDEGFALPRAAQAAVSACSALVAGGCQFYLMHVRYPHASYGPTKIFQLLENARHFENWGVVAIALFPWIWTVWCVFSGRLRASGANLAMFAGSLIFACMWLTVGRAMEIRIFLPYAFALVPLTATAAMRLCLGLREDRIGVKLRLPIA